jgi:transposase
MQDHEFFAKVLGLEEPWEVKNMTVDLPGTRVEVTLECQPGPGWVTPDGRRLHVHGWEERRRRHLDTMQLETVLVARVPRLLDPQSGRTEMATVPLAKKGARWHAFLEDAAEARVAITRGVSEREVLRIERALNRTHTVES